MASSDKEARVPRRIVRQGGNQLEIIGVRHPGLRDLYHHMVSASWGQVIALLGVAFLIVNALFGVVYMLIGGIAGARPDSFADAFFFSVQTIGTIGYGVMAPQTLTAHLLVTFETMVGMLSMAMSTGLVFAKFSRPTARVMFSKVAVIAPRDGVTTLMFRVANERSNSVVEAQMSVALMRTDVTQEGEVLRRLYDLPLTRRTSPAFILSWTAMHQITPGSPLYGMSPEELQSREAQIFVTLTGIDESLAQTIHARYVYRAADLRWGVRLADVIVPQGDGKRVVDYRKFHDVVPAETPSVNAAARPKAANG